MEQKNEFVKLALRSKISMAELCRRYGISRPTGYKWIKRYKEEGIIGLKERSRRPLNSPTRTDASLEKLIVKLRTQDPAWGAKKLHKIIENDITSNIGPVKELPCRSTVHRILKRKGLIEPHKSERATPYIRFEREAPNELWQMDYKGYFKTLDGKRCDPLTVTDDHSRFNIILQACSDQRGSTVEQTLTDAFRRYGMPLGILCDNGAPWGSMAMKTMYGQRSYSYIEKWLMTLNVKVTHGRPYHPQTQGKEERFHRTLKEEVLLRYRFASLEQVQNRFDKWRNKYNHHRPHEAIDLETPSKRYAPSNNTYPELGIPFEYDQKEIVRKVDTTGRIRYKSNKIRMGKAFIGDWLALKPTSQDGEIQVYFRNYPIRTISLKV